MRGTAGMVSSGSPPTADEGMGQLTQALAHRCPDGVGYWRMAHGRAGPCDADELSEPADIVRGAPEMDQRSTIFPSSAAGPTIFQPWPERSRCDAARLRHHALTSRGRARQTVRSSRNA